MSRIQKYVQIFIIIIFISFIISGCEVERPKPEFDPSKLNMSMEATIALEKAAKVYNQVVLDGQDLSAGPCLSNDLHGNPDYSETMWVLDIAHNPREDIDNLPENQCSAYREGLAENFIELDTNGKLIKLYSPLLNKQQ